MSHNFSNMLFLHVILLSLVSNWSVIPNAKYLIWRFEPGVHADNAACAFFVNSALKIQCHFIKNTLFVHWEVFLHKNSRFNSV